MTFLHATAGWTGPPWRYVGSEWSIKPWRVTRHGSPARLIAAPVYWPRPAAPTTSWHSGKLERNPIGDLRHLMRGRSAPVDAEDRVMSSAGATTNSQPTNVGVLLMWQ